MGRMSSARASFRGHGLCHLRYDPERGRQLVLWLGRFGTALAASARSGMRSLGAPRLVGVWAMWYPSTT